VDIAGKFSIAGMKFRGVSLCTNRPAPGCPPGFRARGNIRLSRSGGPRRAARAAGIMQLTAWKLPSAKAWSSAFALHQFGLIHRAAGDRQRSPSRRLKAVGEDPGPPAEHQAGRRAAGRYGGRCRGHISPATVPGLRPAEGAQTPLQRRADGGASDRPVPFELGFSTCRS